MKSKLLILLSLITTFICGLFLIDNNTYAYETNQTSYTLTYTGYNQNNAYIFSINDHLVGKKTGNYIFMANFDVSNISSPNSYVRNFNCYFCDTNFIQYGYLNTINVYCNWSSDIFTIVVSGIASDTIGANYIWFQIPSNNYLSFSNLINYDLIDKSDLTLTPYIDTYVSNLNNQLLQLQNSYNQLENNYDTLQSNYNNLNDDYTDLQTDYNQLESQFNIFNSSIIFNPSNFTSKSLTLNNTSYSWSDYSVINYTGYDFTLFNRDISNMSAYNSNSSNVYQEVITLDNYYQSNFWIIQASFILSETYNDSFEISFFDDLERVYTINYTDTLQQQSNSLILNRNIRFNRFIITFNVNGSRELDNGEINLSIMGSYQNGYDSGYQQGNRIGYQKGVYDTNNSFQSQLDYRFQEGYNKGYGDASDVDENLVGNVIFSVAETPFAVFSQMLNFEIFGINFSGLFYGLLSMILVIFLIKKFMGK